MIYKLRDWVERHPIHLIVLVCLVMFVYGYNRKTPNTFCGDSNKEITYSEGTEIIEWKLVKLSNMTEMTEYFMKLSKEQVELVKVDLFVFLYPIFKEN